MAFDYKGAFAAVTDDARDAALRTAQSQLKGVYAPPVEVSPQYVETRPAGAMEASLPPETTGGAAPSFVSKYGMWIAIAVGVLLAIGAFGRKRK